MKSRDILRFSLELFLPERMLSGFARSETAAARESAEVQTPETSQTSADQAAIPGFDSTISTDAGFESRPLIIEIDSAQFGGPSFGEQSIAMMAKALDEILQALPPPVAMSVKRELAAKILKRAADGERNPDRLRQAVLAELVPSQAEQGI